MPRKIPNPSPNGPENVVIAASDSPSIDGFSRWRVSNPILLVSSVFDYNKRPEIWDEKLNGGGTATHLPNERSVALSLTAAANDSVAMQTKEYFIYRTGQSQQIFMTFCMGTGKNGLRQRIGYFDSENGIFLERSGDSVRVVKRSFTTGVAVDTPIEQADWNIDPLDGSGASKLELNLEVAQILVIDLQWLGVGRVRVGFDIDGILYYIHEFLWANKEGSNTVYMTTGSLPLRYEVENISGTSGASTLKAICSTAMREGTEPEPSYSYSVDMDETPYAVPQTNLTSILAIRLDPNTPRGALIADALDILVTGSDPIFWKVLLNPTINAIAYGAPTWAAQLNPWTDVTSGISEYSTTNVIITGGTTLSSGYAAGGAGASRGTGSTSALSQNLAAVSDVDGEPDIIVVCAKKAIAGVGTSNTQAALSFREFRG